MSGTKDNGRTEDFKRATAGALRAMAQAGYTRDTRLGPRAATIIGTGIGGMITIEEGIHLSLVKGGRPHPLMVPKLIPSACPANLSMRYGMQGPAFAVASACSSATQAIGLGLQMVRAGMVDVAVVGGTGYMAAA